MKHFNMEVGLHHEAELRAEPLRQAQGASASAAVRRRRRAPGFTLIELLVVISIIALLAGLIVGLASVASRGKVNARVTAELKQIETAINSYYKKYGFYPQDNRNDVTRPPLYYELTGINPPGAVLATLAIAGIANTESNNFFPNLRPMQRNPPRPEASGFWSYDFAGMAEPYFLVVPYHGPEAPGNVNTWRYRSTKPEHNTESFDLWADVIVAGKPVRIANWKD